MTLLFILTHISLSFLIYLTMASGFSIQWNCQGLDLLELWYNAPVICLQEINSKDDQMTLKGYIAYH